MALKEAAAAAAKIADAGRKKAKKRNESEKGREREDKTGGEREPKKRRQRLVCLGNINSGWRAAGQVVFSVFAKITFASSKTCLTLE